jgi:hypothetical protein
MKARLVIVRGEATPSSLDLDPDHPVTVGRSRENSMVLDEEHAARQHLLVYFQGGHWFFRDLGSRSGIRVNSVRVPGEGRLLDGDEIAIADVRLHFQLLCGGKLPPPGPALDPACRTVEVLLLARSLYQERRFEELPVLGDALEELGCQDAAILEHCREPGPHFWGCWVVDLVLNDTSGGERRPSLPNVAALPHSVRFVPSTAEGLPDVREVVVHPDRLEVNSGGRRLTFPFRQIGRRQEPRLVAFLKRLVGKYAYPVMVADRDWFHLPRDRFFLWYTDPPLRTCMPQDEPADHAASYFSQIQAVVRSGGYATFDLG